MRKPIQFRTRNYLNSGLNFWQVCLLPQLDVYWSREYPNYDEKVYHRVVMFGFGWLAWHFEFWFNAEDYLL